jgi:hypothetical protein
MSDISFDIVKSCGTIAQGRGGWMKELNLVAWNGRAPKFDIREWAPDHEKMGKGITLNTDEARKLVELLQGALEE